MGVAPRCGNATRSSRRAPSATLEPRGIRKVNTIGTRFSIHTPKGMPMIVRFNIQAATIQ